jgi:epsilon-lactone hydrolase
MTESLNSQPSTHMRFMKLLLRLLFRHPSDLTKLEHTFRNRTYPQAPPPTAALEALCEVKQYKVQDHLVYELKPKQGAADLHILYTHGGSYVYELARIHWDGIEQLIRHTRATVTLPLYPLAPEFNFRTSVGLLEELYIGLLARLPANQVVLCGDSAGGGLALALAMHLRDAGLPQPGRVMLFSPWLDLTLADPVAQEVEQRDVMLRVDVLRMHGQWWAGGEDARQPLLSPLFGDLTRLSPIDLFQGTDDIFIADARTFHRRATEAGADVRLYEATGGCHVFMLFAFIPEAKAVYRTVAQNLNRSSPEP